MNVESVGVPNSVQCRHSRPDVGNGVDLRLQLLEVEADRCELISTGPHILTIVIGPEPTRWSSLRL